MQDEAILSEIFSYELLAVALPLLHNNGKMRKSNKTELMNEISTFLIDVLMESAFHVTSCDITKRSKSLIINDLTL